MAISCREDLSSDNLVKLGKMTISTIKGANKLCQSYIMMETVYIVITMSFG